MKKLLISIFNPAPNLSDIQDKADSTLLTVMIFVLIFIFGSTDIYLSHTRIGYTSPFYGYFLLLMIILINRFYSFAVATYLFLLLFPAVILYMIITGTATPQDVDLFCLPIFLSFLFLRLRTALIFTLYNFGLIAALPVIAPEHIQNNSAIILPLMANVLAGSLAFLYRFFRDRVERSRKTEIRENQDLYRLIVENMPDYIARYDSAHRYLYVSPNISRLHGIPESKFIGQTHSEMGFPGDFCLTLENTIDSIFETGEQKTIDLELTIAAVTRIFSVRFKPERNSSGNIESVLAVSRDITRQRKLEARIKQSEKLETVGRISSQIAHDFNNQLCVIMGIADIMNEETTDPEMKSNIEMLLQSAQAGSDLTKQLLSFSHRNTMQTCAVDMNELVEQIIHFLKPTFNHHIAIETNFGAKDSFIKGDPSRIHDALINIAFNARDAMTDGGTLSFSTSEETFESGVIDPCGVEADPGSFLAVSIRDTGTGIKKEILDHIFEPFYTTKPKGKGTGLGLAAVYGIMQAHQGFITVDSEAGKGTTFILHFPK